MSGAYRIENEERIGTLGRRGIALTHEIMYRHYRRDEAFVREQMIGGVSWIGPLRAQYATGVDKVMDILKIEELILQLRSRFTVVIVTHNMQQASRISDYTAFFYKGRIVEYDRTGKIFTNPSNPKTEEYITGRFG